MNETINLKIDDLRQEILSKPPDFDINIFNDLEQRIIDVELKIDSVRNQPGITDMKGQIFDLKNRVETLETAAKKQTPPNTKRTGRQSSDLKSKEGSVGKE